MSGFEDIVPGKHLTDFLSRITSINENKKCFDCGDSHAPWASVNNGVFLCINCSGTHRSLGVGLSFIKSVTLDTSWSWKHLRTMQVGGNAHAKIHTRKFDIDNKSAAVKYSSDAMTKYRRKLKIDAFKHHQKFKTDLGSVEVNLEPSTEEFEDPAPVQVDSVPCAPEIPKSEPSVNLSIKQSKKKSMLGAMKLDLNKLAEDHEPLPSNDAPTKAIKDQTDNIVNERLGFASNSYNWKPKTHAAEEIAVEYTGVEEKRDVGYDEYSKKVYSRKPKLGSFRSNDGMREDAVNYISVEPDPIMRSKISHELKKTQPVGRYTSSVEGDNNWGGENKLDSGTKEPSEAEIFARLKNAKSISSSDFRPEHAPKRMRPNRETGLSEFVQTFSAKMSQLKDFTFEKLSQYYDEYMDT